MARSRVTGIGPVLHEEVDRLPERLRLPLVLCYLEGLTDEQAAQRLKWPVGTVRSRLARGRDRLRRRLVRRGLAPASLALGAAFSAGAASAAVPSALVQATIQAGVRFTAGRAAETVSAVVVTLTAEVLRTMVMTKLKRTAMLALAAGMIVTVRIDRNAGVVGALGSGLDVLQEVSDRRSIEIEIHLFLQLVPDRLILGFDVLSRRFGNRSLRGRRCLDLAVLGECRRPYGLADAASESHAAPFVKVAMKNVPIRVGLKAGLDQFRLSYEVRDGRLVIDSRAGTMESRLEAVERKLDRLLKAVEGPKRDVHQ